MSQHGEWTGEQIKRLRERLGLTQHEFALLVGLQTRSAINQLEKGRRHPTGVLSRVLDLIDSDNRRYKPSSST